MLLVDDEQPVLDALSRMLRTRFDVTVSSDAREAVDVVAKGDFAVVMSDLRMPGMDGVAFLQEARAVAPDTVRIMLTGHADIDAAADAVNRGQVFRFLTKPASTDIVRGALQGAVDQHRLLTAERELLEQTLHGSVATLLDTLALADPLAFARASRVRRIVSTLLNSVGVADRWEIEVATMLSHIGAVTLPPGVAEKIHNGEAMSPAEQAAVDRLPAVAEGLLSNIPRLEGVRDIIRLQQKHYDGSGEPDERVAGEDIPLGARILKVALDLDVLEAQRTPHDQCCALLRARKGTYDPELLNALDQALGGPEEVVTEVTIDGLRNGAVLACDVTDVTGMLLVGRGQAVSPSLIERLRNHHEVRGVVQPLYVSDGYVV